MTFDSVTDLLTVAVKYGVNHPGTEFVSSTHEGRLMVTGFCHPTGENKFWALSEAETLDKGYAHDGGDFASLVTRMTVAVSKDIKDGTLDH